MYGIDMPDKLSNWYLCVLSKNFFASGFQLLQMILIYCNSQYRMFVEELLIGYGNYILEEIDDDIVFNRGQRPTDWATLRQVIETNIQKVS